LVLGPVVLMVPGAQVPRRAGRVLVLPVRRYSAYGKRVNSWTWRYEAADGSTMTGENLPKTGFPSQADAETWVGETWHELLAAGVEQVSLLNGGEQVYGPMSLRPLE
jgi:hypothetical protein